MIPREIADKMAAAMLTVWLSAAENKIERSPEDHIAVMVDVAIDAVSVKDIVEAAQKAGDYCCQDGCGGGACETCSCCVAGWCVSGIDGVPLPGSSENPADDLDHAAELFGFWLEAAAEKNPVAKALAESLVELKPKGDPT